MSTHLAPAGPDSASSAIIAQFAPLWGSDSDLTAETLDNPALPFDLVDRVITESLPILTVGSPLLMIPSPLIIVGDLHGSFVDLLLVFQKFGTPESGRFLFLGDYVDRGPDSISVICLILAFLVRHPENVFLLRGNHEFSRINRVYGFHDEIRVKYETVELWDRFQELFSWLSLAAIVNGSIFCVHGGLSPDLPDVQTVATISLPIVDYSDNSMICDLVWSDPVDSVAGFRDNLRGSGKVFGRDCAETFLHANNLKFLVRAHQCIPMGWRLFGNLVGATIFSSSNYCHLSPNKCGVLHNRDERELAFFTIDPESDLYGRPSLWALPMDGDIGLKRLLRASSRPDIGAAAASDKGELIRAAPLRRSQSVAASLLALD
jgi:diadenosine tetraphosphatase ApaH/serine/threonine PP2A family protein phosphatase